MSLALQQEGSADQAGSESASFLNFDYGHIGERVLQVAPIMVDILTAFAQSTLRECAYKARRSTIPSRVLTEMVAPVSPAPCEPHSKEKADGLQHGPLERSEGASELRV